MFAQKSSELQTRGRQLNRTPGEGSMSDFETKLLGGIYALPSDNIIGEVKTKLGKIKK
jgi:hypothetical protein